MSRHRILRQAQADLAAIQEWIEQDDPRRAVSFVAELIDHFRRLAERPMIGRARPELGIGVRSMLHGNYVIFYRPTSNGISIYRVMHGRRSLSRGLQ